ncbi:MAG TPA: heterodisulfide reductase-related iron-sulfur binding cluster [Dehalococcoidia bacterium]|nr:heterodisulfide reductase-related iron-sulfur binding cluster [Dehalococcoidia bacterium]
MAEKSGFRTTFAPTDVDLSRCVHCGLCLQSCPTYLELGLETESPRGRLYLMKAIAKGRIEPTPTAAGHIDLCLQCRNCEAVCPSGVPFGAIMEDARADILSSGRAPLSWRLRAFLLRQTIPHPRRLRLLATLLRLYQRSGLRALAERFLPRRLREASQLAPELRGLPFSPRGVMARPQAPALRRVALVAGCMMAAAYGDIHRATARVLVHNGCEVISPPDQACCGSLFSHNGDRPTAMALARRNIDAFLAAGVDAIIINAAGCGAALKEYGHLLADDPTYGEKARSFSAMVKDISEFLVELPFQPPATGIDATVTYQDSCHLGHAQGIRSQPRQILESIPGLRLLEMAHPDRCCGSAGIYNLTNREMSLQVLDSKMAEVSETSAQIIATSNPGCILQLEAGLKRQGRRGRVFHVVELLDQAYQA